MTTAPASTACRFLLPTLPSFSMPRSTRHHQFGRCAPLVSQLGLSVTPGWVGDGDALFRVRSEPGHCSTEHTAGEDASYPSMEGQDPDGAALDPLSHWVAGAQVPASVLRRGHHASTSPSSIPAPTGRSARTDIGEEGGSTPLEHAADATGELYRLRHTFFPWDPAEKTSAHAPTPRSPLLDYLLPEQKKSPQQHGVFEFSRGKVLDVFPDYNKEAEDHLSKAVCSKE